MKKIKLSARHKVVKATKNLGTYAAERELTEKFKQLGTMDCPCCFGTMVLVEDAWQCQNCSYCISQNDMLSGAVFWFCDGCGEFLNVQPGFTTENGKWVCVRCQWTNDVTEENMID